MSGSPESPSSGVHSGSSAKGSAKAELADLAVPGTSHTAANYRAEN